jgi:Flavoprotein
MDKLVNERKRRRQRIVVGIAGATGIIYGIRALQVLRELDIETHLVVSRAGEMTREHETVLSRSDLHALADVVHPLADVGASIASGSYRTLGMLIAPCSVRTLARRHDDIADAGRGRGAQGASAPGLDGARGAAARASYSQHAYGDGKRRNHPPACSGLLYQTEGHWGHRRS